ncbi:hypothetical protein FQA39_LY07249 [Lamprigera yunnana]|nr:hypothetical protein FQA39_LY07249 [Lamprigera yunnana]
MSDKNEETKRSENRHIPEGEDGSEPSSLISTLEQQEHLQISRTSAAAEVTRLHTNRYLMIKNKSVARRYSIFGSTGPKQNKTCKYTRNYTSPECQSITEHGQSGHCYTQKTDNLCEKLGRARRKTAKNGDMKIVVIAMYAPTGKTKDTYKDKLAETLNNLGTRNELILLGDFNARRTGKKTNEPVMANFGESTININGH